MTEIGRIFVIILRHISHITYVFYFHLIYSYKAEKNARKKQQRLLTCILITPTTLFAITANYILRALRIESIWRYNAITISGAFIIFVYASFRYGVMGVRVKFEKYRLDSTIKAITSGTSIMNHSIKNEIIKIGMCTNTIKSKLKNQNINIPDIDENIGFILDSSDYLTKMVKHIQKHIQEITLNEQVNNVKDIFTNSINMVIPFIKNKEIILENNFDNDLFIKCDSLHIQEVFHNILKNAIEAMEKAGKLKIDTVSNKSTFIIAISDIGCGISKENLPYVFDPFFSTKRTSNNFGLGLSYCVNVMNLHGGKLEVISEKNVGTTIQIIFHKSRVSGLLDKLIKRSLVNG